jgi:hypothetical protein
MPEAVAVATAKGPIRMTHHGTNDQDRISTLERSLRRNRLGMAALGLALIGVIGLGMAQQGQPPAGTGGAGQISPIPGPGKPIGISVVQTKAGSDCVVFRLWSHGHIDRRLLRTKGWNESQLTYEAGWIPLPE